MSINNVIPTKDAPLMTIKEKSTEYTRHDQLFKQLIEAFFEEFIEAFFPDLYNAIDFEQLTYLSEEHFTEMYDGNKKVADLVVEVKSKETDALILVHGEPQSSREPDFHKRMFEYFALLAIRTKKIVFPIAIFSYDAAWEKNEFHMEFADLKMLSFQYKTLHLRKQNWRTFIKKDNPIAGALLGNMGYADDEKVQVKLEFFKILARLKLDREKTSMLLGFFENYLSLTEEEEEIFMLEAEKLDKANEILELPISYEEKGKEIGREEGRKEGKTEGLLEGRKHVARNLLAKGLDLAFIAEATMLSIDEIKRLKEKK